MKLSSLLPFRILIPCSKIPSWFCEFEVVGGGSVSIGGAVLCYTKGGILYAKLLFGNSILRIDGVCGCIYPKFKLR